MIWLALAFLCLLIGAILLIRCAVLQKRGHALEDTEKHEAAKQCFQRAKRLLWIGIVFLVLAEAAVLLGKAMQ